MQISGLALTSPEWLGTQSVDEAGMQAHTHAMEFYRAYMSGPRFSLQACNHALEICERRGDRDFAWVIERDLERNNKEPNYHTYTFLIGCYGRAGAFAEMERVYEQMKLSSEPIDIHLLSVLIEHFGRSKMIDGA